MNIFFNSRINANQSLLNVLFGQQQKATSSQNTGCRGTRQPVAAYRLEIFPWRMQRYMVCRKHWMTC
jgi:hypothetical protein